MKAALAQQLKSSDNQTARENAALKLQLQALMSQQQTQSSAVVPAVSPGPSSAVVPAVTNDTVELAVLKNAIQLKDEHSAQLLAFHGASEKKVLEIFHERIGDLKETANHQRDLARMHGGGRPQNMRPPWMGHDSQSQSGQWHQQYRPVPPLLDYSTSRDGQFQGQGGGGYAQHQLARASSDQGPGYFQQQPQPYYSGHGYNQCDDRYVPARSGECKYNGSHDQRQEEQHRTQQGQYGANSRDVN